MRTTPNRITNCIDRLLLQQDETLTEWCAKHGFHLQHFSKIKHGRIEPTGWVMLRIARAFGVSVDDVFGLMPTNDIWDPTRD